MTNRRRILRAIPLLLVGFATSAIWAGGGFAQAQSQDSPQTQATPQMPPPAADPAQTPRPQPPRLDKHAVQYYSMMWGIEDPSVKWAEAGELIRFSFRVLDPEKAKTLNDKKLEPKLVDPEKGVELVVPSLENVGALRQSSTPIAGKVYWMAFSNSGRPVRRGDRVNVVIGNFHAVGLIVE